MARVTSTSGAEWTAVALNATRWIRFHQQKSELEQRIIMVERALGIRESAAHCIVDPLGDELRISPSKAISLLNVSHGRVAVYDHAQGLRAILDGPKRRCVLFLEDSGKFAQMKNSIETQDSAKVARTLGANLASTLHGLVVPVV